MPGPSNYTPTTKNTAQYYRPFFVGNVYPPQDLINHGICMGCTYVQSMVELPSRWFVGSPEYFRTLEYSKDIALAVDYFKLIDEGKRGSQPFVLNTDVPYFHITDQLGSTYQTTSINYYSDNWGTVGSTGKSFSPWGLSGICLLNETWKRIARAIKSAGTTLDYVLLDMEGTQFDPYIIRRFAPDARIAAAILNDPRYTEEWQGLSSWQYYYEGAGGVTTFDINDKSIFFEAWGNASTKYVAKYFTLSHYNPITEYFPDVVFSNYGKYLSDGFTAESTNIYFPNYGGVVGNASSSINYTTIVNNGLEGTPVFYINEDDSASAQVFYLSPLLKRKSKTLVGGYWSTFKTAVQQIRQARRNSPDLPHHPWIGSVNMHNQGFVLTNWSVGSASQSDTNVIQNSWNKENITGITKGATAPDGSTNAFIVSIATTGSSFSLDYFLYGVTPGATYTFSYFIDLDRGFTTPYFLLRNWKTYLSTDPVGPIASPLLPSGKSGGVTFTQILPITSGPHFKEALIGFSAGNSGWTKVAFQFQGTTNPYLALSSLRGGISSGLGYTGYIWNPQLEIQYSSGVTASIGLTAYDAKRYEYSSIYPPMAYGDFIQGYDPNSRHFHSRRGGNSAYYYEMIRHFFLLGCNPIAFFNTNIYVDLSQDIIPDPILGVDDYNSWIVKSVGYFNTPGYDQSKTKRYYKDYNDCHEELNNLLGGFTLTTANLGWEDWLGKYFSSGAPIKGSSMWLWRITSMPGHTLFVNGETLSPRTKAGTWVTTPSNSLSTVDIKSTKWELPEEPAIIPPLKDFNFAGMTTTTELINAGFTFSRGSTASYIDGTGTLKFVGPNQARFAYDQETLKARGLVLEAPATNLLNWSESFATSGGCNNNWIDVNISRTTGQTSPSNTLNAIKFTATGSNATLISSALSGVTIQKSFSFWMKGETGTESAFYTFDGGTSWSSVSNLSTNWKRYELGPFTPDGQVGFKIGNTGNSIFIWGAQLETRLDSSLDNVFVFGRASWDESYCISTSYVPSNSTRGTRSADSCSIRGSSFTSWFGITQGTIVYEASNNNTVFFSGNDFAGGIPTEWHSFSLITSRPQDLFAPYVGSFYIGGFGSTAWSNSVVGGYQSYPYRLRTGDTDYKFSFSYEPQKMTLVTPWSTTSNINNNFISLPPGMNALYLAGFLFRGSATYVLQPFDTAYIKRIRYWDQVIPEKVLYPVTVGGSEFVRADNSVDYTWEVYNRAMNEYGLKEYYGSYFV